MQEAFSSNGGVADCAWHGLTILWSRCRRDGVFAPLDALGEDAPWFAVHHGYEVQIADPGDIVWFKDVSVRGLGPP